jgi:hypothetical protein
LASCRRESPPNEEASSLLAAPQTTAASTTDLPPGGPSTGPDAPFHPIVQPPGEPATMASLEPPAPVERSPAAVTSPPPSRTAQEGARAEVLQGVDGRSGAPKPSPQRAYAPLDLRWGDPVATPAPSEARQGPVAPRLAVSVGANGDATSGPTRSSDAPPARAEATAAGVVAHHPTDEPHRGITVERADPGSLASGEPNVSLTPTSSTLPASEGLVSASVQQIDGTLTQPPPRPADGLTADRLSSTDTGASAVNRAVLRQTARADVVVGSLGRISVTATSQGTGSLAVQISTNRDSTADSLAPHVAAIAADVRAASIPLDHVELVSPSPSGILGKADYSGSSGREGGDRPEQRRGANEASPDPASAPRARSGARVRIVL